MNDFKELVKALADGMTKVAKELAEAFEAAVEKIKELRDEIFERRADMFDSRNDRKKRREAALLAGQRAAARAKAYSLRMQLEKARRALRRRKRLHSDSGLPDW